MAITKSAKKAIRQSAVRKEHNIVYKNKIKVLVKEARALVSAKKMAEAFENYEFSQARQIFEDFFWKEFCDNYLEIVKKDFL